MVLKRKSQFQRRGVGEYNAVIKVPEVTADDAGFERGASSFSAIRAAARHMVQTFTSSTVRISRNFVKQPCRFNEIDIQNCEILQSTGKNRKEDIRTCSQLTAP